MFKPRSWWGTFRKGFLTIQLRYRLAGSSPASCRSPTDAAIVQESSFVIIQGLAEFLSPTGWTFGDEISVDLIPNLEATLTFTFKLDPEIVVFECQEDFTFTPPGCSNGKPVVQKIVMGVAELIRHARFKL